MKTKSVKKKVTNIRRFKTDSLIKEMRRRGYIIHGMLHISLIKTMAESYCAKNGLKVTQEMIDDVMIEVETDIELEHHIMGSVQEALDNIPYDF